MTSTLRVMAHCLAGHRPQPFIADPVTRLPRYRPIVLARDQVDRTMWGATPIFESQQKPGWTGSDLMEPGPAFNDIPSIFLAAIRDYQVCLLHCHHGMFALEFLALRAQVGLPLIVSFYGFDASGFPRSSAVNDERLRNLFDVAALVLAMSDDMRRDLLYWGCPPEKVVVHSPAVDTERFGYSPPPCTCDTVEILCVSDFSSKKGILTLLEAFSLVASQEPRARLRLVGSPITIARPVYEKARSRVEALGLGGKVSFEGWRDYAGVADLYRAADIFVLPSEQGPDGSKEGVPIVILEAMASGRPVVSTYHAGIPDVVVDGETGLLVPERDIPALARALLRLIASPELRASMGRAGRRRVEQLFNLSIRCERLAAYYDHVLGAAGHIN